MMEKETKVSSSIHCTRHFWADSAQDLLQFVGVVLNSFFRVRCSKLPQIQCSNLWTSTKCSRPLALALTTLSASTFSICRHAHFRSKKRGCPNRGVMAVVVRLTWLLHLFGPNSRLHFCSVAHFPAWTLQDRVQRRDPGSPVDHMKFDLYSYVTLAWN